MPNKIYTAPETAIVFAPSGGSAVFTPTSLANAAGRISARFDRGAGSRAATFRWRARTRVATTPTIGTVVRVYIISWDEDFAFADGAFGSADAAVTSQDLLRNVRMVGSVAADEASITKDFVRSGIVWIPSRYISVAWWNETAVALSATATDHEMELTPMPDEVQ